MPDTPRSTDFRPALYELSDSFRELDDTAAISYAAGEVLGRWLKVSRAGYGTIDRIAETITIERDWNAPGIATLAGTLQFRDYGSYIDDLKRGETVICTDAFGDPRTRETADALVAISAQSFINMPVTERGGFVALIYLNHATARSWSEEEVAFLRDVAERTRTLIERRRAERELRELAASLERQVAERTADRDRIWRNSRDLLVVIGADGIFRAVNPAWTAILGHEPEEVVGRSFHQFVWPDDARATQGALDTAASQSDLTNFENRYRRKDGTQRWISWQTSTEGDLVYAYGRNITAEKEQEQTLRLTQEALRQAQKMEAVGQLTGGIAHDFNNLLAGITGSLEMLGKRLEQGRLDSIPRYVDAAQGAAKRAAALTQRLLAFSRRQTLDPRVINLNRLVADMEELIRRTVGPEITIEVVGAGGLWLVLVDPNQFENALLNLCINARDAMPTGGRLTIETANKWLDDRAAGERELPPGQYVSLCVTDTGTGMTPSVIERAFDPFFTTKPLGQGTGLGLSMIYGFVRQSGGQVRIYSEVEEGTTMCLYLPRHLGEGEDTPPGLLPAPEAAAGRGEVVLVVDDDVTVRMLVVDVLTDAGYTAMEAADGPAALRLLQSYAHIDLLVTDVGLPGGLNGRQVADAGRLTRPDLKVLFITGYADNAVIGNGYLDPGMQIVTKPFAIDALRDKIREILEG
ncbi:MAG: response regulator [Methylobacterium sp.]|uniref:ATP-binding protein n=1 Tax=Methylobacterium sp. TaxID=409 RepID=UPI0034523EE6|nr:response regulator [Methylobacterium sp.]